MKFPGRFLAVRNPNRSSEILDDEIEFEVVRDLPGGLIEIAFEFMGARLALRAKRVDLEDAMKS